MSAGPFAALERIWHATFGEVKCHLRGCHVCADTDWPLASWVSR